MQHLSNVVIEGAKAPLLYALGVAEVVYKNNNAVLVVTSCLDGTHEVPSSLHYRGFAADLRTKNLDATSVNMIVGDLKKLLFTQGFDVVLEDNHIHIEFQPQVARSKWLFEVA